MWNIINRGKTKAMKQQQIVIQVPTFGKYHYFFYGLCTEDQLSPMIATAEQYGCEFVYLHAVQVTVNASRLSLPNAKPVTVDAFRIFVRCPREEFEAIKAMMEADARLEKKEGFRPS